MKRKPIIIFGISIAVIICLAAAVLFIINSPQFKQRTAQIVSQQIQSVLKNKVNMDALEVVSVNSAAVNNIEIYDKKDELIAKADKVTVTIDFWDIVTQSPLAGISDVDEYLIELDKFISSLNNVKKVEVLPYHTLGTFKWEELNIPYQLEGVNPPSQERVDNANKLLHVDNYK